MAALAEAIGPDAVAWDLPGHGAAPRLPRYAIADMADALEADLLDGAILFGHSYGGCVALALAARRTRMVAGLVMEDPPLFAFTPERRGTGHHARGFAKLRALMLGPDAPQSPQAWERHVAGWGSGHPGTRMADLGPEAVARRARQLAALDIGTLDTLVDGDPGKDFDPDAHLAALACPVAVVAGEPEHGGVLNAADRARLSSASVPFVTVAGEGHFIHESAPAPCLAALRAVGDAAR